MRNKLWTDELQSTCPIMRLLILDRQDGSQNFIAITEDYQSDSIRHMHEATPFLHLCHNFQDVHSSSASAAAVLAPHESLPGALRGLLPRRL